MSGKESLRVEAGTLRKGGGELDAAVTKWRKAYETLANSTLPANALGEIGEDVRIRIEESRQTAVESIDKGHRALKWNKYALQAMANVYEGTEERNVQEVVDSWIRNVRLH